MARITVRTTRNFPYWASTLTALTIMQSSLMIRDVSEDGWMGVALLAVHTLVLIGVMAPAAWYWRQFFRAPLTAPVQRAAKVSPWTEAQREQEAEALRKRT
jgi:hypothetical protein